MQINTIISPPRSRADGKIGETFLLAKISGYAVHEIDKFNVDIKAVVLGREA